MVKWWWSGMTRVLVCGGRDYADRARLFAVLDHYHAESGGFAVVIHGAAPGADSLADEWARLRGVPVEAYPAAWDDLSAVPCVPRRRRDGVPYNAAAGGIRNERMLREGRPDVVLVFPGGRGTEDMYRRAMFVLDFEHVIRVPA